MSSQTRLVDGDVDDPPSQDTVWVVSTRPDGSPHPYVEAVYDNEEAAKEHKRELADNSFGHGVVAWDVHERTVSSDVSEVLGE